MAENNASTDAIATLQKVFNMAGGGQLSEADLVTVATTLVSAGNLPMASYLYETWLTNTRSSRAYVIYTDFGEVLVAANELSRARTAFRSALQLSPSYERARAALAKLPPV